MQLNKKTYLPVNELRSSGSNLVNNAEIHESIETQLIIRDIYSSHK